MIVVKQLLWYFYIYGWRDLIEIIAFTGVMYYFSRWLQQDRQKPLLLSFYGYCATLTFCYYANLSTVVTALVAFSPVVLILFIILHQQTLQKNFITLHAITTPKESSRDWIDVLIQTCLVGVSDGKELQGVIERKQPLATLLQSPHAFNSPITEGLLELLLETTSFNQHKLIWLTEHGTLMAINSTWTTSSIDAWLLSEAKEQPVWLQEALFFTTKCDALFFRINPTTRTFCIVVQGKLLDTLSAGNARITLKKYLGQPFSAKGDSYASTTKTASSEQSLS